VADLGHGGGILIRHGEVQLHRLGALDEQPHRLILGQLFERRQPRAVGERQRRHREFVLAREMQRRPAGDQHLHMGRGGEQRGDKRGSGDHLLEVVEQQQPVCVVQCGRERLKQWLATRLLHAQRRGDGGDDQRGVGDRRKGDEIHPIREVVEQLSRDVCRMALL
jgi:hypothetical protein